MGPLIKITSDPLRLVRITEQARLLPSDIVELERRKAIAYRISTQISQGGYSKHIPIADIVRINRTFSSSSVLKASPASRQANIVASSHAFSSVSSDNTVTVQEKGSSQPLASETEADTEFHSSYAVERGAFEMRVSRGDVTFIPALTMTIITQMPELHFEYSGGFNYVPPRDEGAHIESINLYT